MQVPDIINSGFEVGCAIVQWYSVVKLYRAKGGVGYSWATAGLFAAWNFYGFFYYWNLSQWWSLAGDFLIGSGNFSWAALALYYSTRNKWQRSPTT